MSWFVLILASCLTAASWAPVAGATLLFSDDFDGSSVDAAKWHLPAWTPDGATYFGRTQLRVSQTVPLPLPTVSNGVVRLALSTYNPTALPGALSFYGSELVTNTTFQVGGGIVIEVRARLVSPIPGGIVGGMFAYNAPATRDGPHDEVDVELVSNRLNQVQTQVYANEPLGAGHPVFHGLPSGGSVSDFHAYKMEIMPDRVSWYVDGQLLRTDAAHVPKGAMQFYLNAWAPAADWSEAYNAGLQPSAVASDNHDYYMEVDSVVISTAASPCVYSITPTSAAFVASGGVGTVSVMTSAGCPWTAASSASWLTVTSGASGSGNGAMEYSVTTNAGAARAGTITIAGETFSVTQAAQELFSGNYQGLWWNAPAESESGWGINLAHQGDVIFATWFTYDVAGDGWWLSMTANKTAEATYSGTLIETTGPVFSAAPFDPAKVTRTAVGTGTLTFGDGDHGTFDYTVNGVRRTKTLVRQVFGPLPTCTYGARPDFAAASNYQDLWWIADGAESGWGINLTHQGDTIFATWFTYDIDGTPMWLSATAPKSAPGIYGGQLIRTTGPVFNAVPFDPGAVTRTVVGIVSLTFANGNLATLAYTLNGVTQTKPITRQLFVPPAGTVCGAPYRTGAALACHPRASMHRSIAG